MTMTIIQKRRSRTRMRNRRRCRGFCCGTRSRRASCAPYPGDGECFARSAARLVDASRWLLVMVPLLFAAVAIAAAAAAAAAAW